MENICNLAAEFIDMLSSKKCIKAPLRVPPSYGYKKKETQNILSLLLRGDYLLSHFRSTIGVVRLNFSVRNGKRWNPHAIITFLINKLYNIYENKYMVICSFFRVPLKSPHPFI